jgi:hypothetical protein
MGRLVTAMFVPALTAHPHTIPQNKIIKLRNQLNNQ